MSYFHGNVLPKGKGFLPHSLNSLIPSFFAFSLLPRLSPKASLGKPEQKVAGTCPVCLPRRAPSQKEGAPHRVPGIWCPVWKGSVAICLGLYWIDRASQLSPVDMWIADHLEQKQALWCSLRNDHSRVRIKPSGTAGERRWEKQVSACSSECKTEPGLAEGSFKLLRHTADIGENQRTRFKEPCGKHWLCNSQFTDEETEAEDERGTAGE